ncbi:MAG: hypothetical protein A2Z72_03300 [Omnitrophica bacterium RBG_13_46_9]|nr:MAG: hypothetical protein A2Z72_03300 [Omnitrophica bacterium RBG_13_46_9]
MSTMNKKSMQELEKLHKKVRFYKILSILFACIIVSICLAESMRWIRANAQELGLVDVDKKGPYYEKIKKIMEPVRYSGLKDLIDLNTRLTVDFEKKEWTLHNIHHFDKDGKIVLTEGCYGLCGDLAVYMYERVSTLLDNRYSINFVYVSESNFFQAPRGSHVALKVTDKTISLIPNIYIIDPTFRKYRKIEYFEDYAFYSELPYLQFYKEKSRNETFLAGTQCPIFIKGDFLLSIGLDYVEERFDENNFVLFLTLTKRHKYFSRPIFALRKRNGIVGVSKNDELALKVLNKQEFELLCEKVSSFFYRE